MIRHCRHIFNTNSLISWFNSNCKCPVCRYDIRDYEHNNDVSNSNHIQQEQEESNENDENSETNSNVRDNTRNNRNNRNNRNVNTRNINNQTVNLLQTLFHDTLTDLSNNTIEYTFDNTSDLFTLLFPETRRSEARR
jgi:hypothetical protein